VQTGEKKALDEGNKIREKIKWQQRNKSIGTENEIKSNSHQIKKN
jgi:hypothetical protein